jgi:membrane protease YdiL (CAAX protease family)
MGFVLGLGLVLGVMRWRSGSTTLTIMLHAAWNLATGITVVLQA